MYDTKAKMALIETQHLFLYPMKEYEKYIQVMHGGVSRNEKNSSASVNINPFVLLITASVAMAAGVLLASRTK